MEISELAAKFLGSEEGRAAVSALGSSHGIDATAAESLLGHAAEAGGAHVNNHHEAGGLFGEHAGRNFFAAFAAGIVNGDGLLGALEDGAIGALVGRVTEALVDRAGVDSSTASAIAATATPFLKDYLKRHIGR